MTENLEIANKNDGDEEVDKQLCVQEVHAAYEEADRLPDW